MKRKKISIKEFLGQVWPTPPQHEVEEHCDRVWERLQQELEKQDTSLWSLYGDGWSAPATTQLEFQVLTAASALADRADLDSITDMVEGWTGGTMIARVQSVLYGLEKRGLVKVRCSKTAGSDGEPQIRFDPTEDGDRALRRAEAEGKQLMHTQENLVRGEAQ